MRLFARPTAKPGGFTLAEVLAALAFLAIVLPVAVEGLRLASGAGQLGERRLAAGLVAERVLNELALGQSGQSASQSGTLLEGAHEYRWQARWASWPEDTMSQLTVEVFFTVRGRPYDVSLTTLIDSSSTL